jgi:hypothetical protein
MAKMNNKRLYPNATKQPCHKAEFRLADAKQRQKDYATLTIQQKLSLLDMKLGKDVGAVKQRARLNVLLTKQTTVKKDVPQEK